MIFYCGPNATHNRTQEAPGLAGDKACPSFGAVSILSTAPSDPILSVETARTPQHLRGLFPSEPRGVGEVLRHVGWGRCCFSYEFKPLNINKVTASWCFGGRPSGCPLGDVLDPSPGYQLARATRTPYSKAVGP